MSCAFGCGEHNDLRVLPCKTVVCFKCINERLVIIQLNCLICKRIHLIPYPSQLKRQTNIEVAQNHSNNNLLQPLQPTDSSRNQIYGKNNSNIYRDFQWPDSNIIIPSFIFALLIFPIV